MSDWQPIETAPKGERVLAWHPLWRFLAVAIMVGDDRVFVEGYGDARATHWMPLPDPPKGATP